MSQSLESASNLSFRNPHQLTDSIVQNTKYMVWVDFQIGGFEPGATEHIMKYCKLNLHLGNSLFKVKQILNFYNLELEARVCS